MSDITAKELQILEKAMKEAFDRMAEKIKGVEMFALDIAQKGAGARAPFNGGELQNRLVQAVTADMNFFADLRAGRTRKVHMPIPGGLGIKASIINPGGQNQPLVPAERVREIIFGGQQRLTMRDIIPALPTASNLVEFPSESTYTSAARPQGDSSPGGVEDEPFAESSFTFTLSNSPVVTLGHWVPASQQILDDATVLADFLTNRLIYGLKLEEEGEILTGDGTAGTLNGLVNQAVAYNAGSTNDTLLDTLHKAKTQLALSNYSANGVVLHPSDFQTMALAKDSQLRYIYGDPKMAAIPTVWSIPIVVSNSMTAGQFLMGDFVQAARIWDRSEAQVEFSTGYQNFFVKHMVAIKCWERLALTVYRTTALVLGNTSHSG